MLVTGLKRFGVALSIVLSASCASFKGDEVASVDVLPDVSNYQNKPSVFVDMRFYRGLPNSDTAMEFASGLEQLQPKLEPKINEMDVFSEISFDALQQSKMDYTLKVDIYSHGNEAAAAVSGFITGFTLGVIPGAATDNYTVVTTLVDSSGATSDSKTTTDHMTTFIGWLFLPLAFKTPTGVATDVINNQIRAAVKELIDSGEIKYSLEQFFMKHNLAMLEQ